MRASLFSGYSSDLARDADRLGIYLAAKEQCGFRSAPGDVAFVSGPSDFHEPTRAAFDNAVSEARHEERMQLAALSEDGLADYCAATVARYSAPQGEVVVEVTGPPVPRPERR